VKSSRHQYVETVVIPDLVSVFRRSVDGSVVEAAITAKELTLDEFVEYFRSALIKEGLR
jgi:hypothetical protein